MKSADNIDPDLLVASKLVYEPCGLYCSEVVLEKESKEYAACSFFMNDLRVMYRVAKITPTKNGQFVILWKREKKGPIKPYDYEDLIDLFIISVRAPDHFGQFVFPKSLLVEKGVVSSEKAEGKRAIRLYPPWDIPSSSQAEKTKQWQLPYFLYIDLNKPPSIECIKRLFPFDGNPALL